LFQIVTNRCSFSLSATLEQHDNVSICVVATVRLVSSPTVRVLYGPFVCGTENQVSSAAFSWTIVTGLTPEVCVQVFVQGLTQIDF